MNMDASNPSKLRRSSRLMAAKKSRDESSPQQQQRKLQVNYVLPEQKLERDKLHVSCLPPEVLTRVFRWLTMRDLGRVACVCAGWRDLVYNKSLWCDVTFTFIKYAYNFDCVGHLLLLDSLLMRGIRKIKTNDHIVLLDVAKHLPQLHGVTLYHYLLSPTTWSSSLLQQLINLTQLNLVHGTGVTDESIQLVAEHLKKLVTLNLDGCSQMTNSSMEYIAMGLPELKNLHLSGCYGISNLGVGYLCGIGLNHPPAKLPQLQYLNLSNSLHCTDLAIRHLSNGQSSIQQLHLGKISYTYLSDAVFQWLAIFRELHHLDISFASITGRCLVELANAHSQITYLDMTECICLTDRALEYVGQLKQLRTLVLENTFISDAGLERLVKGGGSPISTLNLRECRRITNEAMRHVSQLRQLHRLDYLVGNAGLAHLADGQSPVAIVECSDDITEVGLSHVARLPNLQSLNLSSCRYISADALREFVANARGQLTELRLCRGCRWYTYYEAGLLVGVARRFPALTELHLQGRRFIKKEMVVAASLLPRLHSFFLNEENIIEKVRSRFNSHVFH